MLGLERYRAVDALFVPFVLGELRDFKFSVSSASRGPNIFKGSIKYNENRGRM